jgi:plasmid stabilization system protein ParE
MPHLKYTPQSHTDIARFYEFLKDKDMDAAFRATEAIVSSLNILKQMPYAGRAVFGDETLREYVIEFGNSGYVAMYRYEIEKDRVTVLKIKHQREYDYT